MCSVPCLYHWVPSTFTAFILPHFSQLTTHAPAIATTQPHVPPSAFLLPATSNPSYTQLPDFLICGSSSLFLPQTFQCLSAAYYLPSQSLLQGHWSFLQDLLQEAILGSAILLPKPAGQSHFTYSSFLICHSIPDKISNRDGGSWGLSPVTLSKAWKLLKLFVSRLKAQRCFDTDI